MLNKIGEESTFISISHITYAAALGWNSNYPIEKWTDEKREKERTGNPLRRRGWRARDWEGKERENLWTSLELGDIDRRRYWQQLKRFQLGEKQKLIWPRIAKTTQEFGKVSFDFPYTLTALASLKKNSAIWNGLSLRRNSEPNCGSGAVVFDGFTTADLATQIFALEELEDGWEQRKRGPREVLSQSGNAVSSSPVYHGPTEWT